MKKEEKKEIVVKNKNVPNKNKQVKEKKTREGIFKRIGRYFRGVGKEVKRIKWTNGRDLVKYSIATLIFVLILGIYFYGIDWISIVVRGLAQR